MGTLNSASLSANFTNRLVDYAFNLSVNNLTYNAVGTGLAFDLVTFRSYEGDGHTISVTCAGAGCAPTYGGSVNGGFAGDAATTAWLGYQIYPDRATGTAFSDVVQGNMAFTAATLPTVGIVLPTTGSMHLTEFADYTSSAPGFPAANVSGTVRRELHHAPRRLQHDDRPGAHGAGCRQRIPAADDQRVRLPTSRSSACCSRRAPATTR